MQPIVSDTGYRHILMMKDGRAMIAGTRLKVECVVTHIEQGGTPEEFCETYAHNNVTLGQVHSALAYYYDNKELVDVQIQDGDEFVERLRKRDEHLNAALKEKIAKWKAEKSYAATVKIETD